MTTLRQRMEALDELARSSGKSREEVLRAVAGSWGLNLGELAQIRQGLASTPEPSTEREKEQADARRAADEKTAGRLANAMVADIETYRQWRELRERNPFAAANLLRDHEHAIERGRQLDTDSEPPNAA